MTVLIVRANEVITEKLMDDAQLVFDRKEWRLGLRPVAELKAPRNSAAWVPRAQRPGSEEECHWD